MNKKIIFCSGGTGGHIFPAIGIMEYFLEKNYSVLFITDIRGKKYLTKDFPIKTFVLNTDTPFGKAIHKKLISFIKIIFSTIKSLCILIKERPHLVFGLGGYVSFPVSLAAKILNIPLIIYDNNLVLGRTNRYLLPFTSKLLIASDFIEKCPQKYKNKIKKVGYILRKSIIEHSNSRNKDRNNDFSILVLGGSQGAEIFGKIIPIVIKKLHEFGYKIEIFHQCIEEQRKSLINFYESNQIKNNVFKFSNNILEYILKSNIAISRCGASAMAELSHAKTPFIAVPYPYAIDDHQYLNAKYYRDRGCCWIINQEDFNDETLFNLIIKILKNKKMLDEIEKNMLKFNSKNTNQEIEKTINEFWKI